MEKIEIDENEKLFLTKFVCKKCGREEGVWAPKGVEIFQIQSLGCKWRRQKEKKPHLEAIFNGVLKKLATQIPLEKKSRLELIAEGIQKRIEYNRQFKYHVENREKARMVK